jgi:hypothetical protein
MSPDDTAPPSTVRRARRFALPLLGGAHPRRIGGSLHRAEPGAPPGAHPVPSHFGACPACKSLRFQQNR